MDISASKIDKTTAVVALVVMEVETLKIIYEKYELVKLTQPYVPGFLAFREVDHLKKLIDNLKETNPELMPQVVMIDGNGILHSNRFGLACHLGVLSDIPTIGCGKTVFAVDGITVNTVTKLVEEKLKEKGDYVYLKGKSGSVWGAAYKSSPKAKDPVIVSHGHRICLETALKIVDKVSKFKVVEPVNKKLFNI
jgi:deoxyinosine 3'endonuclease (endonuclease V)